MACRCRVVGESPIVPWNPLLHCGRRGTGGRGNTSLSGWKYGFLLSMLLHHEARGGGWYTSITAWPWWKSKIPLGLCWWGCYFLNMFCFSKHPDSWCFGRENWFFLGLCASMCPLALLVLTFLISRDSVRDTKDSVRLKENPRGHSS